MSRIISIANQKGGVGKTTTSVNLAASLSAYKQRVLLIDLDPQGNATMGSGLDKSDLQQSVYNVLVGDAEAADAIENAEAAGYDLLGADADLTGAEIELTDFDRREYRLREALLGVRVRYDFIIIDCPPALGLLTLNGLVAADSVIIPMQCEYYALEGLSALMDTISRLQSSFNRNLKIEGLVRTMYDPRSTLTNDVSDQLKEYFGDKLYQTCIPRNVRLAEAPSFGQPALIYDRQSKGAIAYLALAGEFVRRSERAQKHV